MKKLCFLISFISIVACHGDDDKNGTDCIGAVLPPIEVTVTDASSGEILTDSISVTAVKDNRTVSFRLAGPKKTSFVANTEDAGAYVVYINKKGYEPYASQPFAVLSGPCGPVTHNVSVLLYPLED